MPDIFNRDTDVFGGSFPADQAQVTFPALTGGGADSGLLMQNMQVSYTQQITRLYEVGSPAIYYVGGRTAGQFTVARVVGPHAIALAFYSTYGDVCNAATNTLNFSMTTGCGTTAGSQAAYTAHFVVIATVGLAVAAQDMLINEQLAGIFSSFLYQA
jgi:hypothetical protein